MTDTRKKRLLFVQTQAENAGAQEISRLLGEGLNARGHEVHHLFFYRKSEDFRDLENQIMVCGKRPNTPLALMAFFKNLVQEIRTLNPDIVFTFQHFGNVIAAPAARLAGVKTVIANQVSARELIHPALRMLDAGLGLTGFYDAVTVNSHDLKRDYMALPARYRDRIVHVPHGFQERRSNKNKAEARQIFNLPQDAPVIGCVARLNATKRLDLAIQLLSIKETWHLVIAGEGPEETALRQLAQELDVTSRVHFIGSQPPEEIGTVLKALDAFVFPSRAETFGLAAVEAADAGCPVVAHPLPVLREVLSVNGHSAALFVDTDQIKVFANAVQQVLSDKAQRDALTQTAAGLADLYSLNTMIDAYEQMTRSTPPEGMPAKMIGETA